MNKDRLIAKGYRAYRRRKNWQHMVQILAAIVVFCCTYALILPAATMDAETICGLAEHSHGTACLDTAANLICDLAEHTHDSTCYPISTSVPTEETMLICGDHDADLESPADWEASFADLALTGDWSKDLLSVAQTQLDYTESSNNYAISEDGNVFGYTRYGQWYGQPYADWSALFVSFCLNYAEIDSIQPEQNCQYWLDALSAAELYRAADAYTPAAGDLIFFDRDSDGICDHVGIVERTIIAAEGDSGTVQVIAGGINDQVGRRELSLQDASILGYCVLPSEPNASEEPLHTFADGDGTQTQVGLPADTDVPADAALTVTPITEDDAQYDAMAEQVLQAMPDAVTQMTLLDISFYDADGEYLSVSDTAQVDIHFPTDIFGSGEVKVFHFVDGTPVELETVTVDRYTITDESGTDSIQTQLAFETDGFSVFAVVEVAGEYGVIPPEDTTQMAGSYYILGVSKTDALGTADSASATTHNVNTADMSTCVLWTLEHAAGNTYYVYSEAHGMYLTLSSGLGLTATKSDAALITLTTEDNADYVFLSYNGSTFLNLNGGTSGSNFSTWTDDDRGSRLYLYKKIETGDSVTSIINLDGSSFAIVNESFGYAMLAEAYDTAGLKTASVSIATVSGEKYVFGDNITIWTFTQDTSCAPGEYYISTTVDGSTKYLNLSSNNLTLGNTGDIFAVSSNNSGKVIIRANGTNINLYAYVPKFAGYNDYESNSQQSLCRVLTEIGLHYNLNAPSGTGANISNIYHDVTVDGAALLKVQGSNDFGTFVNTITSSRSQIISYYGNYNTALGDSLNADNYLAPGQEYAFLGWKATATDGIEYLFPENATATLDSQGYILIKDTDGIERTLYPNTTLTGQWKLLSDVVLFFINYGDTMLATEESHDIAGTSASLYTGIVAIGHLYNPVTVSPGYNSETGKNTILKSNDALIQAQIVPYYDPTNTETQLVIDAIAQYNSTSGAFAFVAAPNYNQTQLEESVGAYLRNDTSSNTQVRIDNALIDKSEITTDNYQLYWYAQKEVDDDGYHIDGVLVAKTYPLEIYKTFSGLTSDEAASAINSMTFPLSLIHTNNGADEKDDYTTLTASGSQDGVYVNHGKQGNYNIYKWTLNSIQGQRYAFEETGYTVTDHDCSSLISVHYADGTVVYHYNTDTTFDTADLFADKPLVGGEVESVIFANFYTEEGTGAFSVSKVQAGNDKNRLSGAEFTLTDSNGTSTTAVTNVNGAVHFADLAPGTYTLKETKAPDGYVDVNTSWTVDVKESNGVVTVEIYVTGHATEAVTLYDSSKGGIQQVYLVENTPKDTTLTVTKYFSGLTAAELEELKDNYCIELWKNDGSTTPFATLTMANGEEIVGVVGYQWSVTEVGAGEYRIVEKNYHHSGYQETVVSAVFNGETTAVTKDETAETASFIVTMTDQADSVEITNRYTDTFQLKLQKVDSTTGVSLSGAVFKIYSLDHAEATTGETYEYTDSEGNKQIAYYVGSTTASDESGIAVFDGLKLSSEAKTYIYVFEEFQTPNGYLKLDAPIISSVTVGGTDGYTNGVLTLAVQNTHKDNATLSVTTNVAWNVPWDEADCPAVTLTLYRQAGSNVTAVGTVTVNAESDWQAAWSDLPYAAEDGTEYTYYVSETTLPGYMTNYSTDVTTLTVGTVQVQAAPALGTDLNRSVTVTNTSAYELPETGGIGAYWFSILGLLLMLTVALLATFRQRRQTGR